MAEQSRRRKAGAKFRPRLIEYAIQGNLRGMPDSPLDGASPERIADTVIMRGISEAVVGCLDGGKHVLLSGEKTPTGDELARQFVHSKSPGGVVFGGLMTFGAINTPGSPFTQSGMEATDAVRVSDRAWFDSHPDRCVRIRPAQPTESAGYDVPPGFAMFTAVITLIHSIGMRIRLIFCVPPGLIPMPLEGTDPDSSSVFLLGMACSHSGSGWEGAHLANSLVLRSRQLIRFPEHAGA